MELINTYLLSVVVASLFVNTAIALYGVFFKPHYTKKVIALTILSDTANTFAIYLGYRRWTEQGPAKPPVLLEHEEKALEVLVERGVDPLPQALVLTAIVIGLAVILFLVFLGYVLYVHYGTLDMREIKRLRG
ncbi:MAG: sodium:proton antiporter [Desulfurococcaceae archaeon]